MRQTRCWIFRNRDESALLRSWNLGHRLNLLTPTSFLLPASMILCSGMAFAQPVDKDPVAIVELGGAAGRSLKDGGSSFGADAAVEFTPIENWLELEAGVTPLFSRHHSTEWNTDLLFKKPWTLSRKAELMAGVGPEWVHTREPGTRANSIAGEAVLDFMFWPGGKHRLAGSWNRATITISREGTNSLSASAAVCSSRSREAAGG